jgi:hypothetical protein
MYQVTEGESLEGTSDFATAVISLFQKRWKRRLADCMLVAYTEVPHGIDGQALIGLAGRLRAALRGSDTVVRPAAEEIARILRVWQVRLRLKRRSERSLKQAQGDCHR